ncbi:LysR family transcriptional regulator [Aquabacterium sp. A7-Y]|uniref:LysR family transcriptional regulator n=1 Tax=Aquabacterium sp. A7-Y TaxID=1349605 RepID=UPI00223CAAD7|nr:LysR family transcriptional regulator [Aquabacterium sp. A7-Y]MCW7538191.1 LysR family transcriptional regulator [Aquabacterium sp. A7-Y]
MALLMVIFARVAEYGSFTRAAERLSLSKAAVSKEIQFLEANLGVKLLFRTTRSVRLTEAGQAFYESCVKLLEITAAGTNAAAAFQLTPRGLLRVVAPVTFGSLYVYPVVDAIMRDHPELKVDLHLNEQAGDLKYDAADVHIAILDAPPEEYVARSIAKMHWVLCATPAYLGRQGWPMTPADLEQHECLIFRGQGTTVRVPISRAGEAGELLLRGKLRTNNSMAILRGTEDSLGVGLLPSYVAEAAVAEGRLVQLLPQWTIREKEVFALHASGRSLQPKVRLFMERLMSATAHMRAG